MQRKIVAALPRDKLRWAYLSPGQTDPTASLPVSRGFPATLDAHWRLKAAGVDYLYKHLAARRQADAIAAWVSSFQPQVLWIASDLDGIVVGHHLHHRLGIPIHLTIYDAFEWCRYCGVPRWYSPLYLRRVKHLLTHAATLDGMSQSLLDHVSRWQPTPKCHGTMVFPPSVSWETLKHVAPAAPSFAGPVRRIGFCGASRTGSEQWGAFVNALGHLPWNFEILAFAAPDCFHDHGHHDNVRIIYQPYQPTELDVVRGLREAGVHACYLGLWRDQDKAFFSKTSVSSKMTTYAAAGIPIIADVPEDAAAWGLLRQYRAGLRVTGDSSRDLPVLEALLHGGDEWALLAQGAQRLCEQELNLDKNIQEFKALLGVTAGSALM